MKYQHLRCCNFTKKLLKLFPAINKYFAVGNACSVLIDAKSTSLSSCNSDPDVRDAVQGVSRKIFN